MWPDSLLVDDHYLVTFLQLAMGGSQSQERVVNVEETVGEGGAQITVSKVSSVICTARLYLDLFNNTTQKNETFGLWWKIG